MNKLHFSTRESYLSSFQSFLKISLVALLFSCGFIGETQAQCPPPLTVNGPGSQVWTAPATGGPWNVKITATGAGGGNIDAFPPATGGGGGATMIGNFVINNNERIRAIAGGGGGSAANVAGGGGGGSGAVNCGNPQDCANGFILILAAGGNGEGDVDGTPGSASTGGNGAGGSGCGADCGGGGGGVNSNGENGLNFGIGVNGSGQGGGVVFTNGLSAGGTGGPAGSGNNGGNGMGGGGGGSQGPGGGGGHTGGDAGDGGTAAQSFNSGTDQDNSDGLPDTGPVFGSVVIECLGALPVELINFKALIQNSEVKLLWSTATEKNNKGYDLERSSDNRTWTPLGFIPGNGDSFRQNDYNFTDANPLPGINYYRLKQMDMDDDFEYSPMVVADVRSNGLQLDIFPNPSVDGEISIRAVSQGEGNALLEVYDWLGYKVYKEQVYLYEGTMVYPISLATFPKGSYNVRLEMPDGQVHFKKIVLQ